MQVEEGGQCGGESGEWRKGRSDKERQTKEMRRAKWSGGRGEKWREEGGKRCGGR